MEAQGGTKVELRATRVPMTIPYLGSHNTMLGTCRCGAMQGPWATFGVIPRARINRSSEQCKQKQAWVGFFLHCPPQSYGLKLSGW